MLQDTATTSPVVQEFARLSEINFHITKNSKAKSAIWAPSSMPWWDFAAFLKAESEIVADQPPNGAFVAGALVDNQRRKTAVSEINLAVVQVEGVALADIRDRIRAEGWAACIVSTLQNGRTETKIKRDDVVKFNADQDGGEITDTTVTYYMAGRMGWRGLGRIEITASNSASEEGAMIEVRHDPLPSFLIAVPLVEAYDPTTAASNHDAGIKLWGDVLGTMAYRIARRVVLTREARAPDAMHIVPRCRPTAEPVFEMIEGDPLDWRALGVEEAPAETANASAKPSLREKKKRERAQNDSWMEGLILTEKGAIVSNLPNLRLILENDPRTAEVIAYNDFIGETVLKDAPGLKIDAKVQLEGQDWKVNDPINGDLWSDAHDHALRAMLESAEEDGGYDLRVTDRDLHAAVNLAGKANAFHPVQVYLDGLEWDDTPRVATLFSRYLGAPNDPYHQEAAKLMLLGAVARVYEPGAKLDESVILEGLQGKRKSTFIETLGVHWYGELEAGMDDPKACIEQMRGSWIVEMGELTGLAKADIRRTKAFLSRHTDKARLAYAHHARLFPRGCIFVGSTNDQAYLKDPTGGRRFLPVACKVEGTIDIESLQKEIDQLWAEAVVLYRQMREAQPVGRLPLWLSDDAARTTAHALQSSRTIDTADDMLAGQIEEWLNESKKTRVCLREVWEVCLDRHLDAYTNTWAASLGQIMRSLEGWEATGGRESFEGYGQQRAFAKVAAIVEEIEAGAA